MSDLPPLLLPLNCRATSSADLRTQTSQWWSLGFPLLQETAKRMTGDEPETVRDGRVAALVARAKALASTRFVPATANSRRAAGIR